MNQEEKAKRKKAEQEALLDCETIPIHNIGYIQPNGYLVAIDTKSNILVTVSENITDLFDLPINKILGADAREILPRDIIHQCNNARGHNTIENQREYVGRFSYNNLEKDIFAHVKKGRLILEFQFAEEGKNSNLKILEKVNQVISRINTITDEKSLLEQVVFELYAISDYDRVKAYKFLSDGSGEIVAEAKSHKMDSYLGHRFPAYDIPESARKLYETTPIRIITNVNVDQTKLLSNDPQMEPLDLSLSVYRGIVPVHVMYLQNMGIGSTLTLPITVNGRMWGLFAFHNMTEKILGADKLTALEMLGSSISLILNSILYNKRIEYIAECTRVASALFVKGDNALGFSSYWDTINSELATLIDCDGLVLLSPDQYDSYGTCPDEKLVRKLCGYIDKIIKVDGSEPKPIGIDSIELKFPDLDCGETAGVLAIPKPAVSLDYLLYFRNDTGRSISWAGKPSKQLTQTDHGFRLSPRASFAEYREIKQKTSNTFETKDMLIAETLPTALSKVLSSRVIHAEHRQRMGLVIRELNHRVRNTLALIGSFISQSKGSANDVEDFVTKLEKRLLALSETQKLLTEYNWKQVDIRKLFEQALAPYNEYLGRQLILQGGEVTLSPTLASLLALILNELASNASKYGALSIAKGRVDLTWQYEDGELTVVWKEQDGPKVEEPTRKGFGSTLIKEALYYEFNAKCLLDFHVKGVEAKFIIPVENTNITKKIAKKDDIEIETKTPIIAPVKLVSFVALVLEDDYIISKEMSSVLKSLGASEVIAIPSIEAALESIEKENYDIAFLDANIRGVFSVEVAKLLEKKGIPFAFTTGFGNQVQELNDFNYLKIVAKPVSKTDLFSIIQMANLTAPNE